MVSALLRGAALCPYQLHHQNECATRISGSRHSIFSIIRAALDGHQRWPGAWRRAEPQDSCDAVLVGDGGHGRASA